MKAPSKMADIVNKAYFPRHQLRGLEMTMYNKKEKERSD